MENSKKTTSQNPAGATFFRLTLSLITPRECASAGPTTEMTFTGDTPQEFDDALGTMLDVLTGTVYGGQLNRLQEIIDRSNKEMAKNVDADEEPARQEIATVPTFSAPPVARIERPQGAKGLMLLHCPGCGHTFKHFSKDFAEAAKCFCGAEVPLLDTARFEFTCNRCGKLTFGRTNIEAASVDAGALHCACSAPSPEMRWDPKVRKFHN